MKTRVSLRYFVNYRSKFHIHFASNCRRLSGKTKNATGNLKSNLLNYSYQTLIMRFVSKIFIENLNLPIN